MSRVALRQSSRDRRLLTTGCLLFWVNQAWATVTPGGSSAPPAPVHASTCVEHVPEGKTRPELLEHFPEKMKAGYAAYLEVSIEHGRSENVLADANYFSQVDDIKGLEQTGFILPDPRGGVAIKSSKTAKGDHFLSKVQIPFVALPSETKQKDLTLPPISIQVRRANGETMTLCTQPHPVKVESPTASTPDAKPHANPALRKQLEEWTSLKQAIKIGGIGLLAGALLAALAWLWYKRPKRLPPPAPPRPPWELAFEELTELKRLELLRAQRYADFYANVSDTVRKYLGGRYGYDGLECTTREAVGALRRQGLNHQTFFTIDQFLAQADLVKFARLTPSEPECLTALQEAETIVTATLPIAQPVVQNEPGTVNLPPKGLGGAGS
jgi:hypothetical protein